MTKKMRARSVTLLGVVIVGLILWRTAQFVRLDNLLSPFGIFMLLVFAVGVVVLFCDFFSEDERDNSS